jgi:GGDEF-like domain/PucR C-terminal helix-turn-helix domain
MYGSGRGDAGLDVAAIMRRAIDDAGGGDAALLEGYVETLTATAVTGRRLPRPELDRLRALGVAAAEGGSSLRVIVDLYLSATWLAWRELPVGRDDLRGVGEAVLRVANDAVGALADGYESAQRQAIRHEEAARREFVDDLLHGVGDLGRLAERATRFGLHLAGVHVVATVEAETPFTDADARSRRIAFGLSTRLRDHEVLVTTKDGLLVCLACGPGDAAITELGTHLYTMVASPDGCRIGIGRAHSGPRGVARSFAEARATLDLAARLGLDEPVLHAADLLVYQVLFRDRAAITDLVATVLTPLQHARGGPQPLLDTLAVYFAVGTAAAAARQLHLSVRALTYRLQRIHTLTGFDPTDGGHRHTLHTAVLGARLLDWPAQPLPATG